MTNFDEQIKWLRAVRDGTKGDLEDIKRGVRTERDGKDITDEIRVRAERDIASSEKLIAEYEKLNA